jgi:very-short-patch-repair endonuclease
MNERLAVIAAAQSGVFVVGDATRVGVSTDELTAMVRRREIHRIRRGAYVLADVYSTALPSDRYALRVKAVLRSRGRGHRASHHSALALLGIASHAVPEGIIALEARGARRVRSKDGVSLHPWTDAASWTVGEWRTVAPATACVQVAATSGFLAGVCAMDSALNQKRLTVDDLTAALPHLPALRRAEAARAIAATDAGGESVGETRTRIVLVDAGFAVRSQVEIRDRAGFVGRVDLLVDDCVVVEFDGLRKYAGADGQRALAAEKAREERLTRLGYEVVRVVWSDLEAPAELVQRVRRARRVARARRAAMTRSAG